MLMTTLVFLQLGNALAVRSDRVSAWRLGFGTNRFLAGAVAATVAVQLLVIYAPPLQSIFLAEPLTAADLAVVLVASTTTFWAIETGKRVGAHSRQ
jgi:Ca2+-transporting ATPase